MRASKYLIFLKSSFARLNLLEGQGSQFSWSFHPKLPSTPECLRNEQKKGDQWELGESNSDNKRVVGWHISAATKRAWNFHKFVPYTFIYFINDFYWGQVQDHDKEFSIKWIQGNTKVRLSRQEVFSQRWGSAPDNPHVNRCNFNFFDSNGWQPCINLTATFAYFICVDIWSDPDEYAPPVIICFSVQVGETFEAKYPASGHYYVSFWNNTFFYTISRSRYEDLWQVQLKMAHGKLWHMS